MLMSFLKTSANFKLSFLEGRLSKIKVLKGVGIRENKIIEQAQTNY